MADVLIKVDETVMPEIAQAIMSKTGKSDPLKITQFAEEIEGISVGGGSTMEDGFTVNFYGADNELIESDTVKCGYYVDAPPNMSVGGWNDSNGVNFIDFPFTQSIAGTVIDLYAIASAGYDDLLYEAFGVDKETYPYVYIAFQFNNDTAGVYYNLYFLNNYTISGTQIRNQTGIAQRDKYGTYTNETILNSDSAVDFIINNKNSIRLEAITDYTWQNAKGYVIHSNFDIGDLENQGTNTCQTQYRLD